MVNSVLCTIHFFNRIVGERYFKYCDIVALSIERQRLQLSRKCGFNTSRGDGFNRREIAVSIGDKHIFQILTHRIPFQIL